FDYFFKYYDQIFTRLMEHLMLTASALVLAMLFALPVGFFLSRVKWLSISVLSFLGIIYAIPSLAMFAMLIPLVGLGVISAIIALVALSQMIMVRNVKVGFRTGEAAIIESRKGLGLSPAQLFWKIELPLAMPVILGGVRIAAVSTIGIATIAAWINAGGLGELLFEGLYQNSTPKMLWGTLFVSLLAIVTNQLLLRLEKRSSLRARGELP